MGTFTTILVRPRETLMERWWRWWVWWSRILDLMPMD